MICAACGHHNRPDAKFCGACGGSLADVCPQCGTPLGKDEAFCTECGTPVAPAATPSSPATVPVAGERKHITVLFADVAGSMGLQERLDAEVWAQIMGRFVSILAEGVRKFGGTVDKFTGDGIMALFGAPVAQEDHARRACHAAWQLTKAIGEYSEELRRYQGVELHVRLGLNSGEVVVGRVGDDVTLDPTALGHTVGLAQRMEAMAEPGTAYLTEYTARLVDGWFRVEELGAKSVKGAREPLRVYVLGGPLSSPVRRTVGASPLVGRERELATLEDALAMAGEGQFQVVGVVGEAGVGKSRICDEFARFVMARGITVRRAAGVSHGREVPFLPILAFQREYFGISESDDPAAARQKVTDRLLALDPELEHALPLLWDFLEVPDPDRPVPPMAPDARMRRIFDAVRRITARRSERETLVLIFEDLHWFDPQSEAFLERLIESYPGSRTLVVTNFRPEFSAPWTRHSYYRQLPLAALREQAVAELLNGLLGVDLSLAPLVSFILERTSGNPFFVEEVVRELIEDGTLAGGPGNYRLSRPLHGVRVPPTVRAVLAARIDRLPIDLKAVLETASVIGRTFDAGLLRQVAGSSKEGLEEALSALCGAELLQEAAPASRQAYRFWHALTQEVAYGSLLGDHRRRLHAGVAVALMANAGDRLDELAAVLAWHWEQAGQPLEAARWTVRAGEWAIRSDLGEAKRRWTAAIEFLRDADETTDVLRIGLRARMRLIQYGARTGIPADEAKQLYVEGRSRAERLQDIASLGWLIGSFGAAQYWAGDVQSGTPLFLEAARLAEEIDDCDMRAALLMPISNALVYRGPIGDVLTWAQKTIDACQGDVERGVSLAGYSPLLRTLQARAWALLLGGHLPEAAAEAQRVIAMVRPRAMAEMLAWTSAILPQWAWLSGASDGQLDAATEAVRVGEDTADVASLVLGLEALALAHLTDGHSAEAAEACERALTEARSHRSGLFIEGSILARLALARLNLADITGALNAADEAVETAHRQGVRPAWCLALLTRARILRVSARGTGRVAIDLAAAAAALDESGALTYEPFIHEELGRLHNDDKELAEALGLYRQIGASGHAARLQAELSTRATP